MRRCSRTISPGTPDRPYSEPEFSSAVLTKPRTRGHLMPSELGVGEVEQLGEASSSEPSEKSRMCQGIAQPLIHSVGENSDTP